MFNNTINYTTAHDIINSSKEKVKKEKFKFAKRMRLNPTFGEKKLSKLLKNEIGYKFRRQVVILGYIVDFYLPDIDLIIEVDGQQHNETKEYDIKRDLILEKSGFVVLRITNRDVSKNPSSVVSEILRIGNLIGRLTNPI